MTDTLPPFQAHSDTSRAAAIAKAPTAPAQREVVYRALQQRARTAEELQDWLELSGDSVRPRIVELVREQRVLDTGHRRKTRSGRYAVVWGVLTNEGD